VGGLPDDPRERVLAAGLRRAAGEGGGAGLGVERVVEEGLRVHLAVVDVHRRVEEVVGGAGGELEGHRVKGLRLLRAQQPGEPPPLEPPELEHREAVVRVPRELAPDGVVEAKPGVQAGEIRQGRDEGGLEVAHVVHHQRGAPAEGLGGKGAAPADLEGRREGPVQVGEEGRVGGEIQEADRVLGAAGGHRERQDHGEVRGGRQLHLVGEELAPGGGHPGEDRRGGDVLDGAGEAAHGPQDSATACGRRPARANPGRACPWI
jgi:hypothetical protein